MDLDTGPYNADQEEYRRLVEELYSKYPPITLPPAFAQLLEENLLKFTIFLARYKFVARLIKKTDTLLEVGCGFGMGTVFLGQHCAQATGLDVRASEVDQAKSINRRGNVVFLNTDLFEYHPGRLFDAVVALDVIEHLDVDGARRLLESMRQLLRPSGMLVVGTPSIHSYPYQSPLSRASHVKCYDQEELVSLVDGYFARTLSFSMNDEVVHTGFPRLAWYYFVLAFAPKSNEQQLTNRHAGSSSGGSA